jgi:hypothetical protein
MRSDCVAARIVAAWVLAPSHDIAEANAAINGGHSASSSIPIAATPDRRAVPSFVTAEQMKLPDALTPERINAADRATPPPRTSAPLAKPA